MRCPYLLYFSTALRMHTKHCLLRTHVPVHSLTWLAVPARPYYSHSCLLQDYSSSLLVSTTLACPVVESWVGNITGVSSSVGHCCQHFWVGWGPNRRRSCFCDKGQTSPWQMPVRQVGCKYFLGGFSWTTMMLLCTRVRNSTSLLPSCGKILFWLCTKCRTCHLDKKWQEVRVSVGLVQLCIVVSPIGVTATRLFCALVFPSVGQDLRNNKTKAGYPPRIW